MKEPGTNTQSSVYPWLASLNTFQGGNPQQDFIVKSGWQNGDFSENFTNDILRKALKKVVVLLRTTICTQCCDYFVVGIFQKVTKNMVQCKL